METITGIGAAGCNIADDFADYNLYNIYKIDVGLEQSTHTYPMREYTTHEEYEKCSQLLKLRTLIIENGN